MSEWTNKGQRQNRSTPSPRRPSEAGGRETADGHCVGKWNKWDEMQTTTKQNEEIKKKTRENKKLNKN